MEENYKEQTMAKTNDVVTIVCYDRTTKMKRQDALKFYINCMACSEGAERDRYVNIYLDLLDGKKVCHD